MKWYYFLLQIDSFAVARDNEMHEATRRILSVLLRQVNPVFPLLYTLQKMSHLACLTDTGCTDYRKGAGWPYHAMCFNICAHIL